MCERARGRGRGMLKADSSTVYMSRKVAIPKLHAAGSLKNGFVFLGIVIL